MTGAIAALMLIAGTPLWVESAGTGPPIVFLHAGIADSRMWDAEFQAFRQKHRVVRLDLRGFGRSTQFPDTFAYYEDVAEVLDSLGIDRASIVGCSLGSNVALDFALAYPNRVSRLVLISPSIGDGDLSPEIRGFNEREGAALDRGDLDAATEENVRFWVDGPHRKPSEVDPKVREFVRAMQRHAFDIPIPGKVTTRKLTPPARDQLYKVRARTLVIGGSLDVDHVLQVARRLAREVPGSRLEIVDGAAHVPTLEKPEVCGKLMRRFLNVDPNEVGKAILFTTVGVAIAFGLALLLFVTQGIPD